MELLIILKKKMSQRRISMKQIAWEDMYC